MIPVAPDRQALIVEAADTIQTEAVLLDDRRWDEWLDLYTEDCIFWVPAWRQDGSLVENPNREVSHIYSVGRGALQDRLYRLRSNMSVATIPLQRTTHLLADSRLVPSPAEDGAMRFRTSWNSHVFFPRTKEIAVYFGHYEHRVVRVDAGWKIAEKKIVIRNDYIRTVMDFFFV
jgi:3-phenylpropionate/cinnamic acid dioxygenase small subunit